MISFIPGLIISYYDYFIELEKRDCMTSSLPQYLAEQILSKFLESRVIFWFYYDYVMKNNVKKEKDMLSQLLFYAVFLLVNVSFTLNMVSIEAYA